MESGNLRQFIIQGIFILTAIILVGRLFAMQILDSSYKTQSVRNSVREVTVYPPRGLIKDRKGRLVVNNEPVYDLMMIPYQVQELDTAKLCSLLNIDKAELKQNLKRIKWARGEKYIPQALFKQIPPKVYARFQEFLYQFPGFYPQVRTIRYYPYENAGHVLGYIGEVNQEQIDTLGYSLGDYIGVSGIEKTYEPALKGEKGAQHMVVDVHSREQGSYREGKMDRDAISGQELNITLDIELQSYAEKLMQNKRGSVVAIEPGTGEILTLVSSPNYDPNMLSGRGRGGAMYKLNRSTLKPLFNRALMAKYPPGSTFKPLMALLALQDTVISPNYYYPCGGGYRLSASKTVGCHGHAACYTVQDAIKHSCNAYFCHLFRMFVEQDKYDNVSNGLNQWKDYLAEFGLGYRLEVDLPTALAGFVPSETLYDKMYGEKRWRSTMIISLGIGQGELGVSPLQMAHATAIIANQGEFVPPHIVRPDPSDQDHIYNKKQNVSVTKKHFYPIIDGMERVVLGGTARIAFVEGLDVCGKTGTAENPHGNDHSLFIAFAPKDNPKIALAVIVENGGYGSTYAAPIASLTIEKYLNGKVDEKRKWLEDRIMKADLISDQIASLAE